MKELYAHSRLGAPPQQWHRLEQHLRATAEMARSFAEPFASGDWAWNAGWLHDVGKADPEFQAYLMRENGLDDSGYDGDGGGRVNHSTSGAALAEEKISAPKRPLGRPLAYIAAGHHAGLPDWYPSETGNAALSMRLEEGRRSLERIREVVAVYAGNLVPPASMPAFVKKEQFHLWVRMVFSCLTDADCLDTEAFMDPDKASQRTPFPGLEELKIRLDDFLSKLAAKSVPTPVNAARQEVLSACRAAAVCSPGLFSLTVPTGGGKTLSGMAFALDHAIHHGKKRIGVAPARGRGLKPQARNCSGVAGAWIETHCRWWWRRRRTGAWIETGTAAYAAG